MISFIFAALALMVIALILIGIGIAILGLVFGDTFKDVWNNLK